MFIDRAKVQLVAGKGGNGVVAWRREKYIPKGGPYGGNGGHGGSIVLRADQQLSSLDWFRHRHLLKGDNGQQGGPNRQRGRNGKALVLRVPCGTLIKDVESGEELYDFKDDGDELLICQGGRGGRGNASFATPTNRAPNHCTVGRPGESYTIELELKLIADVGLIGFPNAGKSTLISALTDVKVKIAPYPFTTLTPKLGFITTRDHQRILVADIPGIIEGAHHNRGLGFEFLRHIERTSILVYVLDASGIDGRTPADDFRVLKEELNAYNPNLQQRPSMVILNKVDAPEASKHIDEFMAQNHFSKEDIYLASALNNEGIDHIAVALEKTMVTL